MKRAITVLLSVAFIAALGVPGFSATTRTTKPASKAVHKTKVQQTKPVVKPKAGEKPLTKTEKGLNTGLGKATKFVKRTLTVPQSNPKARKKPADRSKSTLVRGLHTSSHKAGKFLKRTLSLPHHKK